MDREVADIDFEQAVTKLMSFTSISHNKNLSPVAFFLILLEHQELRDIAKLHLDMSFYDLVTRLSKLYPVLHKSRKIASFIVKHEIRLDSNSC